MPAISPASERSVPLHYLGQLCQYLSENGIDTDGWLADVGLGDGDLLSEDKRLSVQQYTRLILSAVSLAPHPYVGLEIGSRLRVHSHGLLGLAVMNCRTLQQVLDIFCRFLAIRTPLVGLVISKQENRVHCNVTELIPFAPIRVYFLEALLATFYQLFRELAGHHQVFSELVLPYPAPAYAKRYRKVFHCDVTFAGPRCEVVLNEDVLKAPVGLPDQQVLADTLKLCEHQLALIDHNVPYHERVRRILVNSPEALPDSDQVARQLHLTKRTLHRYLTREGTQFQLILDEVKATLARHYLQDCGYSVKKCGFMLGYADVANFRRAFKRWFGHPPAIWQQQNKGEMD